MAEFVKYDEAIEKICSVLMSRFDVSANTGYEIAEEALADISMSNLINADDITFKVIDRKTMSEANAEKIALTESWAQELVYCDMDGFAICEDGSLLLVDECGNYEYCPPGRFIVECDN